jgi:hypothetical protein
MSLGRFDRAYMAGIMDGEGSFSVVYCPSFKSFVSDIGFCQVDKTVPKFFHDTFGGSLRRIERKGRKFRNHRPIWRWRIYGHEKTKIFLKAVLPYLRIKKRQATLALEFHCLDKKWNTERRREISKQLLKLNKRGKLPRG